MRIHVFVKATLSIGNPAKEKIDQRNLLTVRTSFFLRPKTSMHTQASARKRQAQQSGRTDETAPEHRSGDTRQGTGHLALSSAPDQYQLRKQFPSLIEARYMHAAAAN